ncbi:MAG: hypothetical protein KA314_10670 [Chloroflexi bacterium]|nr:hypothetical protein [Chloroflexota bacterium]MBP8056297.1 hypothetical protein [Chloroflexota bacterium]
MGTMHIQELLQQWQLEKITTEMTIGHLIQNLANIQSALDVQGNAIYDLKRDLKIIMERKSELVTKLPSQQ